MSTPLIGNIVHYKSYGTPGGEYEPECRAAVVAAVASEADNPILNLVVLNPTGVFFNTAAYAHQSAHEGGTWHYQCRGDS